MLRVITRNGHPWYEAEPFHSRYLGACPETVDGMYWLRATIARATVTLVLLGGWGVLK